MLLAQAINQFVDGYFSTHERSGKTRVAYWFDLRQLAAYAPPDYRLMSISPAFVESWAAHLRCKKYSPASIRRKLVVLRVFCGYWTRRGELHESPFWRVKLSYGRSF